MNGADICLFVGENTETQTISFFFWLKMLQSTKKIVTIAVWNLHKVPKVKESRAIEHWKYFKTMKLPKSFSHSDLWQETWPAAPVFSPHGRGADTSGSKDQRNWTVSLATFNISHRIFSFTGLFPEIDQIAGICFGEAVPAEAVGTASAGATRPTWRSSPLALGGGFFLAS